MKPDFSPLQHFLYTEDLDGYLLHADSTLSNQRYLAGFDAPDPFLTLFSDGNVFLLVSNLEFERAKSQSRSDTVRRLSDYDYQETVASYGRQKAQQEVFTSFLTEFSVQSVGVNQRFPLFTADALREEGLTVTVDETDILADIRAVKLPEEIQEIREVQQATETALSTVENTLRDATVNDDNHLIVDGSVLTSERIKSIISHELLDRGMTDEGTIVANSHDTAIPHNKGSGPLSADEPILIDIFPHNNDSHYHADITRTFVKGSPDQTIRDFHEVTCEAKKVGIDAVKPGRTGTDVHNAVCEVYEDAGFQTLRTDPETTTGFIHSTGHGVGLDVHEQPRVGTDGDELQPGQIITIEPGLYDPTVGGVRIEDLVLVTETGAENLTSYHESLLI